MSAPNAVHQHQHPAARTNGEHGGRDDRGGSRACAGRTRTIASCTAPWFESAKRKCLGQQLHKFELSKLPTFTNSNIQNSQLHNIKQLKTTYFQNTSASAHGALADERTTGAKSGTLLAALRRTMQANRIEPHLVIQTTRRRSKRRTNGDRLSEAKALNGLNTISILMHTSRRSLIASF